MEESDSSEETELIDEALEVLPFTCPREDGLDEDEDEDVEAEERVEPEGDDEEAE